MAETGNARFMLVAFAVGNALLVGTYLATNAQTVKPSEEQASQRWICRQSDDPAAYDATMRDATTLVCKPLSIEARLSDNTMMRIGSTRSNAAAGPDLSHALSAEQVNDAWARFIMRQLNEVPFTGGG